MASLKIWKMDIVTVLKLLLPQGNSPLKGCNVPMHITAQLAFPLELPIEVVQVQGNVYQKSQT